MNLRILIWAGAACVVQAGFLSTPGGLCAAGAAAPPAARRTDAELWGGGAVPRAAELAAAGGVRLCEIKPSAPGLELPKGWKKGVHVAWHKGRLYASFGFNKREKLALPGLWGDFSLSGERVHVQSAEVEEDVDLQPLAVAVAA